VPEPDQAKAAPEAVSLLSELSRSSVKIAIISGRDTDFLAAQLPVAGLILVGNHGLEERLDGVSRLTPEAAGYAQAVDRAVDSVMALLATNNAGVVVEKKKATVAVHYRQTPDPRAAATRIEPALRQIAASNNLEFRPGRLVFELRPPIAVDKGAVLLRLVEQLQAGSVVVAGDDRTDLDAFRVIERIRSRGVAAIAVAVKSAEAPPELDAAADLTVEGVNGMMQLLRKLRGMVGR
jgi:trehalose 6-phosphate phosphatase